MSNELNVGEYGESVLIDFGEDVSSYTITMVFRDPNGTESTKNAVVGESDTTNSLLGPLSANQYATYTIEDGLIDVAGRWFVRGISTEGAKVRKTDWLPLRVKG